MHTVGRGEQGLSLEGAGAVRGHIARPQHEPLHEAALGPLTPGERILVPSRQGGGLARGPGQVWLSLHTVSACTRYHDSALALTINYGPAYAHSKYRLMHTRKEPENRMEQGASPTFGCATHPRLGLDKTIVLQLGEGLLREALGPEHLRLTLQVCQRHAANAADGATEAHVHNIRAKAVRLEDLRAQ